MSLLFFYIMKTGDVLTTFFALVILVSVQHSRQDNITSIQSVSNTKKSNDAKPVEENSHELRLGTAETRECFMQTNVEVKRDWFLRLLSTNVTRFYREVPARDSPTAVEVKYRMDRMWNPAQNLSMRFGCDVFGIEDRETEYCCALRVTAPSGSYAAVEILRSDNFQTYVLYDAKNEISKHSASTDRRVFMGSSSTVNLLLVVLWRRDEEHQERRFVFRLQALDTPSPQVKRVSFNRGSVETPLYRRYSYIMTSLAEPWARVKAPSGHVILVSSLVSESKGLHVKLYAGDENNETLAKIHAGDMLHATIFNTSLLLVQFSLVFAEPRAFQILFSFHNASERPAKLSDNSWNCSDQQGPVLLYHLSCNLLVECHDAEDEKNCSYTSDLCGPGYLTLGGACFFYVVTHEKRTTWKAAFDVCFYRGGRLPSLNTLDKWNDFISVVPSAYSFFLGFSSIPTSLPLWYRGVYQWSDITTAVAYILPQGRQLLCSGEKRICATMTIRNEGRYDIYKSSLEQTDCDKLKEADVVCEKTVSSEFTSPDVIHVNGTSHWPRDTAYAKCPLGHYTHHFLACDVKSSCWSRDLNSGCELEMAPLPPHFSCTSQMERVPYTLVCNHRDDCSDGSDEDFCKVSPCRAEMFSCGNGQCVPWPLRCDFWKDCYNGADEDMCDLDYRHSCITILPTFPPAVVSLDSYGHLFLKSIAGSPSLQHRGTYSSTHFQCSDNGYFLPMLLRCNGVHDCPGREDETDCDLCPGFYRCRGSQVCLTFSDLCDGHAHCLEHDDELMCNSTCPLMCVCRGLAFFCRHSFIASDYPLVRFLDASGSVMTPANLTGSVLMIYLKLANCSLLRLDGLFLPNLLSFHVQDNRLATMRHVHLDGLPQLRELSLAGNPMTFMFEGLRRQHSFPHVLRLDLSRVVIHKLNASDVAALFPNLHVLNMSRSQIQRVEREGFGNMQELRTLDLRGCPMTWFSRRMFQDLSNLKALFAHTFKMCCPAVLPQHFNLHNCFAPSDEISSCDDLLRGSVYSVCVFVLSLLAVVGNAVSFIFRVCISKRESKLGYGTLVTHLSVSDFLMGVYLVIIGTADQVFSGNYIWNDAAWRHSVVCKLAGFLSLMSSEVSAFIMCLITLDRFLVLRFPFSRMHFSPRSAQVVALFVWIIGVILTSVPLLPTTSHWEFYSQTGICIPLPVTRSDFAGYDYSFGIVIILNCFVFVFISLGQVTIYWSVLANSMSVADTNKKAKDLTIARRLITVAMTDFLCWFPICVLGLLASNGVPISGEINVAVAIFVLPVNSAVNPCLYTVNIILERRRKTREVKLRTLLLAQLKTSN